MAARLFRVHFLVKTVVSPLPYCEATAQDECRVDVFDHDGRTALIPEDKCGYEEIVKESVTRGADPGIADRKK